MSSHSWLVRTRHHTILIEACTGNHKSRPGGAPLFDMLDRPYLDRLTAAGVRPEEIDYVLCTHLHADHVGWNTYLHDGRWVPTFPNAKYVMSKIECEALQVGGHEADFATWGPLFYQDSILPVLESRQEMLIEGGFQLGDHLVAESTPGHSPGHLLFALRDRGEEALFSGDIMHHPIQVYYPDWSSAFCFDPVMAASTRRKVLERATENRSLLLPAHFAARGACCISHNASGFQCQGLDEPDSD
ncbi:MBL fold metallo-hydrolase [Rhizobium oryzicola]|uniref:MBL fold metallo-hydrolase n=2 Tax=Rhizobium oryzicola TaxID=1232668 RepID=A0ABT8SYT3_9HYPH|nr:MBL fold metallo-hydrolase [Rhizobium oryzicola]